MATPLSMFDLSRQCRREGRDHGYALHQVAHTHGQGGNADEEAARFSQKLAGVIAECDHKGGE